MTHPQRTHEEQGSSFTITQFALGTPLHFEPALGSPELDGLINDYVPGCALPQQKRAQVVLEFLNSVDTLSHSHPVSIRYHVPQVLTPQSVPRHSSMPSLNTPSMRSSNTNNTVKGETLSSSRSTGSLKRAREEVAPPNTSGAKRLPGFSIMTRDGTDITDLASRGPKTKEQRNHAALMRKLKACAACKRSKQRCDPSHHRPAQPAMCTASPSNPSSGSARLSCVSSAGGSQGSISPQSSLGESFSQSPSQSFVDRTIAQMGQGFPHLAVVKPSLSPSDFTIADAQLTETDMSALPLQDLDPQLFQMADIELDSWSAAFTAFPPVQNVNSWNNHEDIFAPINTYDISPGTRPCTSLEQIEPSSLQHSPIDGEQFLRRPAGERLAQRSSLLDGDPGYSDSHVSDFNIDQWLRSTIDLDRGDDLHQRTASGQMDMPQHSPLQRSLQNARLSRDEHDVGLVKTEAYDTFGEDSSSSPVEAGQWRTTISSDIPGEDEQPHFSTRVLTRHPSAPGLNNQEQKDTAVLEREKSYREPQHYLLPHLQIVASREKRRIVLISLCMLMVIWLLCTISLLTPLRSTPSVGSMMKHEDLTVVYRTNTGSLHENIPNEVRSLSLGLDHGSPGRSEPESGFDHTSSYLDHRPKSQSSSANDISSSEDYSGQCTEKLSPSPTLSNLSGTPTFTVAPSSTKCPTVWTTQLPVRSASHSRKAYPSVTSTSQRQSSVKWSSSGTILDFKRTWSRSFNIGHLTLKVTSLNII